MVKIIQKINELFATKIYAQSLGERLEDALDIQPETVNPNDPVGPYVQRIVNVAIPIAVIACFILLVYGGYLMSSSEGNPDKLQEAKSVITNAVIGLLVVLLSTVILLIIGNTIRPGEIYN